MAHRGKKLSFKWGYSRINLVGISDVALAKNQIGKLKIIIHRTQTYDLEFLAIEALLITFFLFSSVGLSVLDNNLRLFITHFTAA